MEGSLFAESVEQVQSILTTQFGHAANFNIINIELHPPTLNEEVQLELLN